MKAIHILLVEDNEGDILLTTEALEEGKIINKVSVVKDGKQAIDFLNKKEPFENADLPNLILLDINLPKKNGHEVLQYIKDSKHLRYIPIIMLTTSSSENDIIKAYNHYANCFITKPVDVNEFMLAVAKIENFWINIVQLP
ncbi:response regulator [Flavobacterium sangjuense]|uniref:Response regulator rcp1 n=1 Tax=Flavobacterium sangjuense TaxID=2518177 RepID=A0A4P7PQH1_9FLAO|nr:response regulator [Flavobacterium sangjuense]QBZ96585.1 Response regulator rcp1 [Flavobacterium sangjuense]